MSAQQIVPFLFEGERLLRVVGRGEQPWFVAVDACRILGHGNPTMAVRALDEDEKGVSSIETPGGKQEVLIVSEGGLYTLILRSRDATKPGTVPHRFRKWVTGDVLPTIRRTGGYGAAQPEAEKPAALDLPWQEKPPTDRRLEIDTARLLAAVDGPERALWYVDTIAKIPGPPRPYKKRQREMDFDPDDPREIATFARPGNGETH